VAGTGPAHNRTWYQVGPAEYVYSSEVQPVQTVLNQPSGEIPAEGRLAELTVPFTDAYKAPSKDGDFAYRYYYAQTHWVDALVPGSDGQPWYRIREDKWENTYYVPAAHMRLVPYAEMEPLSPLVPPLDKRLVVDSVGQTVTAYEYNRVVFVAKCSTGARWVTGDYFTPTGTFTTFHKRASRHMAAGDLASNGYDLPGVPWVCYFTEEGHSFHGTYWHNDYGRRRSHGCINLTPRAAQWLYRWTMPYVPPAEQALYETYGTLVEVI
jgi:lipoprotein-anchoring transpeptidase ErfK/SrfK